jgi:hypothetical protein
MENGFVKYLFFLAFGMLGVFVGRRMAIKRMMKKKKSLI